MLYRSSYTCSWAHRPLSAAATSAGTLGALALAMSCTSPDTASSQAHGSTVSELVSDELVINPSTQKNASSTVATAYDGTNLLTVWTEASSTADTFTLRAARVSPSNTVTTAEADLLTLNGKADNAHPAVAYDGTRYLIVFSETPVTTPPTTKAVLSGLFVAKDGTPDAGGKFVIDSDAGADMLYSSVTFDGTNYLLVWHANHGASPYYDIVGARVSTAGDISKFVISGTAKSEIYPSVACRSADCLVAWRDNRNNAVSKYDIYGALINVNVPTPTISESFPITQMAEDQQYPSIATDGTNYLVVWYSRTVSSTRTDLFGARYSPTSGAIFPEDFVTPEADPDAGSDAGAPVAGIALSVGTYARFRHTLAFDGSRYLLSWVDRRPIDNTSDAGPDASVDDYNLYGSWLEPNLSNVNGEAFLIAGGTGVSESEPRMSSAGTAGMLISYSYTGTNALITGVRTRLVTYDSTSTDAGTVDSSATDVATDSQTSDASEEGGVILTDAAADVQVDSTIEDAVTSDVTVDSAIVDGSPSDVATDSTTQDARPDVNGPLQDASLIDAMADTAKPDSISQDSSTPDSAGRPDTSPPDSAAIADATNDARLGDSAPSDGTVAKDSTAARDGASSEAGRNPVEITTSEDDSGCGCRTAGTKPPSKSAVSLLGLGILGLVQRRRRSLRQTAR